MGRHLRRVLLLLVMSFVALQVAFVLRIALMAVIDPQSTTFQRSEIRRLLAETGSVPWRQEWVPAAKISKHLERAVIASEDAEFADHGGIDWDALEKAWERNQRAEAVADRRNARAPTQARPVEARVVGGSTISQQLAKNLFLSGERTVVRKGQEFILTLTLEALLPKARLLEIYLNHVEWGEGVFGAQAAARHYFRTDAANLGLAQALGFGDQLLALALVGPKVRPGLQLADQRQALVLVMVVKDPP